MTDLTERLRERVETETSCGNRTDHPLNHVNLMDEAATTLETLTQDNARLREALRRVQEVSAMCIHQNTGRWSTDVEHDVRSFNVLHNIGATARKALGDGDEK